MDKIDSRLLTLKQIIALVDSPPSKSELVLALIARREQDAKTASAIRAECGWCDTPLIKEGECQTRVERIKKEIEDKYRGCSLNLVGGKEWQEFWRQKGVK